MVLRLEGSWSLLVGKRFLSLSEEDDRPWDTSRIAEWPWKSGKIRAVSHTDISKQDLKVTGNFRGDLLKRERLPRDLETLCLSVCVCSYMYALLWSTCRARRSARLAEVPSVLVLML